MKRRIALLIAMLAVTMSASARADSVSYAFFNITNNNAGDAAIGEAQLSVEVTDIGVDANEVKFIFSNSGPDASAINAIYFDDGTLLGIASVDNSDDGVSFSQDAAPPDLPGGENLVPEFNVTAGFLADADNPAPTNGVNPGESVGIVFDLKSGKTFDDVIEDLQTRRLRIGLHVIDFESGGSESFVNVVPLPASAWSGMSMLVLLAGFAWVRRRRAVAA